MDKISFLEDYINGNITFVNYLNSFCYNLNKEQLDEIANLKKPKYYNAALLGDIVNTMFLIKEHLVELSDDVNKNYQSLILESELSKSVDLIAQKTDEGYQIGDVLFASSSDVFAMVRNKLAHGAFYADFEKGIVYLTIEDKVAPISIHNLMKMICKGIQLMVSSSYKGIYIRDYSDYHKSVNTRGKAISSKSELKGLLKSTSYYYLFLKSKDGSEIPNRIISKFNEIIDESKNKHNSPGKELSDFVKYYNLELTMEKKHFKDEDIDRDYNSLWNMIKGIHTLDEQNYIIGKYTLKHFNPDKYNFFYDIMQFMNNLKIIDAVKEYKTINHNFIIDKITDKFNEVYINPEALLSGYIMCYSSIFSYAFDGLYKHQLDFGQLDTSMIQDCMIVLDDLNLHSLEDRLLSKATDNFELLKKRDEYYKSLSIVQSKNNSKAINKISIIIDELTSEIEENIRIQDDLKEQITNILDGVVNNYGYYHNKNIIESLRNSIAHGRYRIEVGPTFDEYYIAFYDCDKNNVVNFSGKMHLIDFLKFLNVNYPVVREFIDNHKNPLTLKRV